jgi:hypothetical protein
VASTITLQQTVNFVRPLLEMQPLEIAGMEPVLGAANLILQTMLGPPFAWPWNRGILTFSTSDQDYTAGGLSNFSFLEGGTVQPASGKNFEVLVKNILHVENQQARALHISPLLDDGLGNITFRLSPAPDQIYTATLIFQNKAPLLLSLAQTWAPIPDEKSYIYQWGFLALMSLIGNDARFNEYNQKFITGQLGAQGGLTDLERNIFLSNWIRVMSQLQSTQLATAERYKAREV